MTADTDNCGKNVPNPLVGKTRAYKYGTRGSTKDPRKQHMGPVEWGTLPQRVKDDFLDHGEMQFDNFYLDGDSGVGNYKPNWKKDKFDSQLNASKFVFQKVRDGKVLSKNDAITIRPGYYPCIVQSLAVALENDFHLKGKETLVLNAVDTWNQAMLVAQGVKSVVSSDIRDVSDLTQHPKLSFVQIPQLKGQFDAIFKFDDDIEGFMHVGLGRYGDYISPYADLEKMRNVGQHLKDDGIFAFSLPIGKDLLEFNAHRIYGPKRLKKMLNGYKLLKAYPCLPEYPTLEEAFNAHLGGRWENQWVLVVQKDNSEEFWNQKGTCSQTFYVYLGIAFVVYVLVVLRFGMTKQEQRLPI